MGSAGMSGGREITMSISFQYVPSARGTAAQLCKHVHGLDFKGIRSFSWLHLIFSLSRNLIMTPQRLRKTEKQRFLTLIVCC